MGRELKRQSKMAAEETQRQPGRWRLTKTEAEKRGDRERDREIPPDGEHTQRGLPLRIQIQTLRKMDSEKTGEPTVTERGRREGKALAGRGPRKPKQLRKKMQKRGGSTGAGGLRGGRRRGGRRAPAAPPPRWGIWLLIS